MENHGRHGEPGNYKETSVVVRGLSKMGRKSPGGEVVPGEGPIPSRPVPGRVSRPGSDSYIKSKQMVTPHPLPTVTGVIPGVCTLEIVTELQ